jgi:hypothetical protein
MDPTSPPANPPAAGKGTNVNPGAYVQGFLT